MKIIGHRGTGITGNHIRARDKTRLPENTLVAFAAALDAGADGIETDIFLSADGVPVCIHDEELNLHAAGAHPRRRDHGFVHEKTAAELARLDVGQGQGVPALADLFALMARYPGRMLHIELKWRGVAAPVACAVREFRAPDTPVVYTGFSLAALKEIRALDSEAAISPAPLTRIKFPFAEHGVAAPFWHKPVKAIIAGTNRFIARHLWEDRLPLRRDFLDAVVAELRPSALNVYMHEVTDELLSYAEEKNIEIYAWTMREQPGARDRSAENFVRRHRDTPRIHLITDYPAAMKQVLS